MLHLAHRVAVLADVTVDGRQLCDTHTSRRVGTSASAGFCTRAPHAAATGAPLRMTAAMASTRARGGREPGHRRAGVARGSVYGRGNPPTRALRYDLSSSAACRFLRMRWLKRHQKTRGRIVQRTLRSALSRFRKIYMRHITISACRRARAQSQRSSERGGRRAGGRRELA